MTRCPHCATEHKGARSVEVVHRELCHTLTRAAEMTTENATLFMRANLLRMGLELSSWCANCQLQAQAGVAQAITSDAVDAVRETEQAMQAATETPLHICKVLPFRARYEGTRDLLNIETKFDSEKKP